LACRKPRGTHPHILEEATMKLMPCLALVALATTLQEGRADAVLDWNRTAIESVVAAKLSPPMTTRGMALVHASVFDAVNAFEGGYTPYRPTAKPPAGASADAAAAGAAHAVLVRLFPDQKDKLDAALAESLTAGGEAASAGAAFGAGIGAALVAARANDGTASTIAYKPQSVPGRYVPTAPAMFADWATAKPFVMESPSRFRPAPPPALSSAQWAADYNEIKALGGKASTARTKEQTEVAQFWAVTGAPSCNPILREFAARKDRAPLRNARLFALAYLAMADTLVAVFDAKYHYDFWRPVTALRNGDLDGNDATAPDTAWAPLVDNPMHPEYPCAHCINAAAVGTVLESEFGTGAQAPFEMQSPTLPGVTRRWTRIADYVQEVSDARVWSGVHFRTSARVGVAMGRDIAHDTLRKALQPTP
jgi:hypothetical protein